MEQNVAGKKGLPQRGRKGNKKRTRNAPLFLWGTSSTRRPPGALMTSKKIRKKKKETLFQGKREGRGYFSKEWKHVAETRRSPQSKTKGAIFLGPHVKNAPKRK